ncbi:hypothetical protein ACHAW6_013241, partial [Cyclotella cf. meneghiniana]
HLFPPSSTLLNSVVPRATTHEINFNLQSEASNHSCTRFYYIVHASEGKAFHLVFQYSSPTALRISALAKMTVAKVALFLAFSCSSFARGFLPSFKTRAPTSPIYRQALPALHSASDPDSTAEPIDAQIIEKLEELTPEQQQQVGNLVADEEWAGLSMELAEVVRTAVIEDLKKNSREFLNKDHYAIGDFSKEIDKRVKDEVAKMREKDEYELGDFSVVLDEKVKEMVCEMTGKEEYEFGDLSLEIDQRVKASVAKFCGKDEYQFGDLSKELAKRTKAGVLNYLGKDDYQFGDLSKELAKRTKEGVLKYTGKEDYQFGDVTKKLMGNLFGGKKEGK